MFDCGSKSVCVQVFSSTVEKEDLQKKKKKPRSDIDLTFTMLLIKIFLLVK